jgi:predicted MFS family arabinose efflux permease
MARKLTKTSLRVQLPLFTFIRLLSSTAFRMMYPFLPAFRDGLGISVVSLTRAIGARSLVAGLVGPFFAAFADSRGRRWGMLLGLGLFVAGSASVVIWPTFPGLVLAMMLTIVGKVTFDPSMQAYLGDRVPYERRSAVLTLTELSWSGAYIIGIPAVGWVIARAGWVAPFPLLGGLVLVSAAALLFILPRDPVKAIAPTKTLTNFKTILSDPTALTALAFTGFSCLANEIVNLTFGVWMESSFGLQLAALGAAAAVLGAAELSGEGLVALITDRLGKRRAIFIGVIVNCLAVALLPLTVGSLALALAVLFLFYISFEFTIVSSIPLMTEVMPAARATMMAGFFTSASFGRAAASWITPGLYAISFGVSLLGVVAANLVSLAFLVRLRVRD